MPPDRRADAAEWLALAAEDLEAGQLDLTARRALTRDSCFHAQQAAEKCLKAVLVWRGVRFERTHDLNLLGLLVIETAPALRREVEAVLDLSPFATVLRYPGIPVAPGIEEARLALAVATALLETVSTLVNG